ncbi:hypothetical protein LEP1GSC043_3793 [Leptospira weilii str. Ecochallenge]|uniref:Uncharacterized protein n=1 Tax=Leptospira weilii str. Ecochallenge TaxID=1049986 RepID=N1U439_9LEPT|nr:hypothetical protein LEP1GSC043_3793 [Leptospira weilii str. Ecochallenge]
MFAGKIQNFGKNSFLSSDRFLKKSLTEGNKRERGKIRIRRKIVRIWYKKIIGL